MPSVLVADDDDDDVMLLRAGLGRSGLGVRLYIARDGQEAVDYLSGGLLPGQADAPARPDLFLLDLTMPRLDGFGVLRWLRTRPELASLPVVVFSYSSLQVDRERVRQLGATEFQEKLPSAERIAEMLQDLYRRYLVLKVAGGTEPPSQAPSASV